MKFASMFFIVFSAAAWPSWFSNFSYRKQIILSYAIGNDLSNYPALIYLTSDNDMAEHASSNGKDIFFTDYSGANLLDYEIEHYDFSSGCLCVWVRIPLLSASESTSNTIFLYYDRNLTAPAHNSSNTWNDDYKGVWHMSQDPSGTAPQIFDSTINTNHGSANGTMPGGSLVAGKIGKCLTFDGIDDYINTQYNTSNYSDFTVEVWTWIAGSQNLVKPTIISEANWVSSVRGWIIRGNTGGVWQISFGDGVSYDTSNVTSNITTDTWNQISLSYLSAQGKVSTYVNGVFSGLITHAFSNGNTAVSFGRANSLNTADSYFKGFIDEIKISKIARSSNYLKTSYANQNTPGSFLDVGIEQRLGYANISIKITNNNPGVRMLEIPVAISGGTNIDLKVDLFETKVLYLNTNDVFSNPVLITPSFAGYTFMPSCSGLFTTAGACEENIFFNMSSRLYTISGFIYNTEGIEYCNMPVFLSGVKELKTFSAQNGYYSFNVPPGMYSLFATNLQYPFLPKSTNVTVISTSLYDVNFIHNIDPYAKNTADKNNFTLLSDRIIKLDQNNFYIRIYNHNQKDIQGIITLHSIAGKTIEKIYDGAMNYGELEFLFSEHIKLSMGVYIIQIVTYFGTNKKRSYWVVSIL